MSQASDLRLRLVKELMASGFELQGGLLVRPAGDTKEVTRALHETQRRQVLEKASSFVDAWEDRLLPFFADGKEVDPGRIQPEVRPVATEEEAALFRFASLHWSVPVSQGYGRRTRFIITDGSNGKLIGIFALGDPVFNLRVRDNMIDWTPSDRQERLYNVFDAFVLGAVEPYRQLIAGKLAALCTVSDEVTSFLETKYSGKVTHILGKEKDSRPVLITTTSALGRSSVYNRIKLHDRRIFQPVGFTEGFGHFQFSEELFSDLVSLIEDDDNFRGNSYGQGPNWKMRTIRTALVKLGLSGDLLRHGIKREVYLAPLGVGWRAFLRQETDQFTPFSFPLGEIAEYYRSRWAIPRAERRPEFRDWSREEMRISPFLPPRSVAMRLF
ncbi:Druantia anti-phage system protein DruA [Streptomyces sp. NPDC101237]|uniref:Druantia anti-phage system protein DruA n=1 Tax=Streptomyces sp. NPDC101237 TaxID=3366139 RepID=UPI0037FA89E4